ncbi:hypothetical protein KCU65_g1028, partial [Aureobasidium melanogenum]
MVGKSVLAGCVAALSAVVSAQIIDFQVIPYLFDGVDTPFTFTDCAAPKEMQTCWQAQNLTVEYRHDEYLDIDYLDDENLDKECFGLQNRIGCALTNCWNRVYSCDYQQLVLKYNETCNVPDTYDNITQILDLPFYPAPVDAAGECSCNLKPIRDISESLFEGWETCLSKVHEETGGDYDDDGDQYAFTWQGKPVPKCNCCVYGAVAAALWDTCPSQDPAYIALDTVKYTYINDSLIGGNITLADCPSILANQSFNCADYGFTNYGKNASDYAKPTPLHSATGTWSDVNGILTSPVSGPTYTWTALNDTFTITAASVDAMATRTASATSSEKVTGSSTGSASGTASGQTSKSTGAAPTAMALQHPAAALVGLGGIAFALL